jgi:hypothetical protein
MFSCFRCILAGIFIRLSTIEEIYAISDPYPSKNTKLFGPKGFKPVGNIINYYNL